jgi:hypothetical protein
VRRISFSANRKKVKAGKPVSLAGFVRAARRKPACQRRQKVAIQRLALSSSKAGWATLEVAVTNKNGRFRATTIPFPGPTTFGYRARVNRTKRCTAAVSKQVKVRATR